MPPRRIRVRRPETEEAYLKAGDLVIIPLAKASIATKIYRVLDICEDDPTQCSIAPLSGNISKEVKDFPVNMLLKATPVDIDTYRAYLVGELAVLDDFVARKPQQLTRIANPCSEIILADYPNTTPATFSGSSRLVEASLTSLTSVGDGPVTGLPEESPYEWEVAQEYMEEEEYTGEEDYGVDKYERTRRRRRG